MYKAPSRPATMSKQRSNMSKQHSTLLQKNGNNVKRVYHKILSFRVECCFNTVAIMGNNVAVFGNNVKQAFRGISFFPQSQNKLNMFDLFRICQKDAISFVIVTKNGNIVTKNSNNVEATFDFVERIITLVAFDNVASTLLLVWTGHKLSDKRLPDNSQEGPASYNEIVISTTGFHSHNITITCTTQKQCKNFCCCYVL